MTVPTPTALLSDAESDAQSEPHIASGPALGSSARDAGTAPPVSAAGVANASQAESRPPTIDDPLIGQVIAGRYRLLERVGEGGMGAVYRGEHATLRKPVAVKFLHAEMTRHADVVARFEREAFAAAQLEHPNVVAAHDFGRTDDGQFFLVMEFVSGPNLRDLLDREGALEPQRALHIARHIAAALSRAHAKGIVHRDLKPDNVVLVNREDDASFAKVIDFGIAKVSIGDQPAGPAVTKAGMVFGTPQYMAPEQALGAAVDHRADLYAFAVLCFELLTGRLPFESDDVVAVMSLHLTAPVPSASKMAPAGRLPEAVDEVFQKALAKRAADRYDSASDFVRALADALGAPLRGRVTVVDQPALTAAGAPANTGANARTPAPIAGEHARAVGVSPTLHALSSVSLSAAAPPSADNARRAYQRLLVGGGLAALLFTFAALSIARRASRPVDDAHRNAPALVAARESPTAPPRTSAAARALAAIAERLSGTAGAATGPGAPTDARSRLTAFRARPDVAVLLDAARGRRTGRVIEAFEQMRAQNPDDPSAAFLLGSLYSRARNQRDLGAQRYEEALSRAPELVDQPPLLRDLVRAVIDAPTPSPTALRLIEGPLVDRAGPVLLETAREGRGATRARALARLATPAFSRFFDETSRDLLALDEARTCNDKLTVVQRLGERGDERALPALRAIRVGAGCGFLGLEQCNPCLSTAVPAAIRAITTRIGARTPEATTPSG